MKHINWILIMLAGLCVSGALQAAPASSNLIDTKAMDSHPLVPGSRVVAGNAKNEFFVLPGSDTAGVKVADNKSSSQPVVSDSDAEAPVKVASSAATSSASHPDMSHIKLALDKALRGEGKQVASTNKTTAQAAHKSHHGKKKVLASNKHHGNAHHGKTSKLPAKSHHLASNTAPHHSAKIHHSKVKKPQIRA